MTSIHLTINICAGVKTIRTTVVGVSLSEKRPPQLLQQLHLLQLLQLQPQLLHLPQLVQLHLPLAALMSMVIAGRRLMGPGHVSMFARVTSHLLILIPNLLTGNVGQDQTSAVNVLRLKLKNVFLLPAIIMQKCSLMEFSSLIPP